MKEKIAVILGSKSDVERLKEGFGLMDELGIAYQREIISAHRNPDKLRQFCKDMEKDGIEVVIACAGMAAALPGFVASYVNIPVLGVALRGGLMDGLDALFAMVSIPKGIGLSCTGVGQSAFINAVIVALAIISRTDKDYRDKLLAVKNKFK